MERAPRQQRTPALASLAPFIRPVAMAMGGGPEWQALVMNLLRTFQLITFGGNLSLLNQS